MKQVKTLYQTSLYKPQLLEQYDAEINALLADGWDILESVTGFTASELDSARVVTLVRYIETREQAAPPQVEATPTFQIGDIVTTERGAGEGEIAAVNLDGCSDKYAVRWHDGTRDLAFEYEPYLKLVRRFDPDEAEAAE